MSGEARSGARARAQIVACETCGGAQREADGRSRGEHLIERLQRELGTRGDVGIDCTSVRCLWACKKSCAVLLRSAGRVGYVIAELPPDDVSARALCDYAGLYLESEDGAVPFKLWPPALKGHFHCRLPKTQELSPDPFDPGEPSEDPASS
jgi:predicted metal-binding protein